MRDARGGARPRYTGAVRAEDAYFFRHALLRDAAYQLQLPGDRARLHRAALEAIESACGGRPQEPPPLDVPDGTDIIPHPLDAQAAELAVHAALSGAPVALRVLYLRRAAETASLSYRDADAQAAWEGLAALLPALAGAEACRRAALCANRRGDPQRAVQLVHESLERAGDRSRLWTAAAVEALAALQSGAGRVAEAAANFSRAIEVFRELGDLKREARARTGLVTVFRHTGRFAEAEAEAQVALEGHRAAGDRESEGTTLILLGGIYYDTGRYALAEQTFNAALAFCRTWKDDRRAGIALGNLGALHSDAGRFKEARQAFEQALSIHRKVGNLRSEGVALANIAGLLRKEGRLEESERFLERALATHRAVGNRRSEGIALHNLGELCEDTGRVEAAESAVLGAIELHRETGNLRFEGISLAKLSELAALRGDAAESGRRRSQAVEVFRRIGSRHLEAAALSQGARALVKGGLWDAARETWRIGAGILRELGNAKALAEHTEAMQAACRQAGVDPLDGPQA